MIQASHSLRVAIIGARDASPDGLSFAFEVGKLLAEKGVIVYSGGGAGIMKSTCEGVHSGGGISVGILKGNDLAEANDFVSIPIMTGMGDLRNGILVRSVQGAIAVEGAYGTLSEIAYTLGYEKPLVGFQTWDIPGLIPVETPEDAVETLLQKIKKAES